MEEINTGYTSHTDIVFTLTKIKIHFTTNEKNLKIFGKKYSAIFNVNKYLSKKLKIFFLLVTCLSYMIYVGESHKQKLIFRKQKDKISFLSASIMSKAKTNVTTKD